MSRCTPVYTYAYIYLFVWFKTKLLQYFNTIIFSMRLLIIEYNHQFRESLSIKMVPMFRYTVKVKDIHKHVFNKIFNMISNVI